MRIRIQLFTWMRIRIRLFYLKRTRIRFCTSSIQLLANQCLIRISNQWHIWQQKESANTWPIKSSRLPPHYPAANKCRRELPEEKGGGGENITLYSPTPALMEKEYPLSVLNTGRNYWRMRGYNNFLSQLVYFILIQGYTVWTWKYNAGVVLSIGFLHVCIVHGFCTEKL